MLKLSYKAPYIFTPRDFFLKYYVESMVIIDFRRVMSISIILADSGDKIGFSVTE